MNVGLSRTEHAHVDKATSLPSLDLGICASLRYRALATQDPPTRPDIAIIRTLVFHLGSPGNEREDGVQIRES